MAPTVLIVDDHPGFRNIARLLLEAGGFEVVGEAPDGESAVTASSRLHPDLVLLDVQLPGPDGFEVADRLAEAADPPVVVLVSSRRASDYGERVHRPGVAAFVYKRDLSAEHLVRLLDRTA